MKRNRVITLLLVLVLGLSLFASCRNEEDRVDLGIFDMDGISDMVETLFAGMYNVHTFPTANEIILAIKSGRIQEALILEDCANYHIRNDSTLEFEKGLLTVPMKMLTRSEDETLTSEINTALETLKEDGKLDELYDKYVKNASPDNIPEAPVIETVDNAKTVIVGITGDLAPYDYISPDGKPSGYNVALFGEIAKLAGFNVKFEQLTFGAKFTALESKRIDVFFVHFGYFDDDDVTQTIAYSENLSTGRLYMKSGE